MDTVTEELKKAMRNVMAVQRYESGYRKEPAPKNSLDVAVIRYKEERQKKERLERFFS